MRFFMIGYLKIKDQKLPGDPMAKCEVCGNDYDKTFTVTLGDEPHIFDSFECAIQALAPVCGHCGCRVIGHGCERNGIVFCCHNCANHAAGQSTIDRARMPGTSPLRQVNRTADVRGDFVIQRASESRCEWWTGSHWSGDE